MRIDISYNRSLISPGDPGRSHSLTCFDTGESFSELLVIIYGASEAPFSDTKQQTSVSVRDCGITELLASQEKENQSRNFTLNAKIRSSNLTEKWRFIG